MKLKTGKVAFPIEFDNGEKDKICFNPNDPELFVRFTEFEKRVKEKLGDIDNVELNEDGTAKSETLAEKIRNVNKVICEELDVAFDAEISAVVFKHCSPLSIVGGEYFLVQFVEAIRPEIEKYNVKASTEMQKKRAKHTGKYQK